MTRKFGVDDWAMLAAVIFFIANCAVGLVLTEQQRALFHGDMSIKLSVIQTLVRLVNTCYVLTVVAVKISIGLFFLHIFNVNQKLQRIIIYSMMVLSTLSGIVFVVMIEGTCGIEVGFDTRCAISNTFSAISITWGILNASSDVVLTALSLNAMLGVKLKLYVKISAMALLAFASIGGAISVVRAIYTFGVGTKDPVIHVLKLGQWSTIEAGIYITTACLVTLRPLLQKAWERFITTTSSTTSGYFGNTKSNKGTLVSAGRVATLDQPKAPSAMITPIEEDNKSKYSDDMPLHRLYSESMV
ncbi:hypothetical protein MBLNU459_g5261t1 [Dothideomycetes sp. NU459]